MNLNKYELKTVRTLVMARMLELHNQHRDESVEYGRLNAILRTINWELFDQNECDNTMKFDKVWFFGGEKRASEDDWVEGYQASNGLYIKPLFTISSNRPYCYVVMAGAITLNSFDRLLDARNWCKHYSV